MQLGMVLERYSDAIIDFATHPVTGIQRRNKWPPSIAEVVEHCDGEVERLARIARYKAMGEVQPRLPPPTRPPECNFDEMVARYGRPLGPFERGTSFEGDAGKHIAGDKPELKRFTADDLRRLYAAHDAAEVV